MTPNTPSPSPLPAVEVPVWRRLGVRLSISVGAILAVISLATLIFDARLVRERELHDLELRSSMLSRSLIARLATAMVAEERDRLHGLLAFVGDQPSIGLAAVLDARGVIHFASQPELIGSRPNTTDPGCSECHQQGKRPAATMLVRDREGTQRYRRVTVIRSEPVCLRCHGDVGPLLGLLILDLKTESMERELADHRELAVAVVGGILLMAILTITLMVAWRIRRPLKALLRATSRVQAGHFDERLPAGPQDELGRLRSAFNAMVERLQQQRQRLESQVEQRTAEARSLDDSLREAQSELLRTNRLATMGEMAAAVAHEVRTPMNSLMLNLHLVRKRCESLGADVGGELSVIANEIRRIDGVIERFLTMARFPPPRVEALQLNHIVAVVMTLMDPEAGRAGIDLIAQLCEPSPVIQCDEGRVQQVLLNLVLNAVQANGSGGRVWVRTATDLPQLVVADDGPGISADLRERVFDPFFSTKEDGTGLGLATASRLLREVGGRIELLDAGPGAVFAVTFAAVSEEVRRG